MLARDYALGRLSSSKKSRASMNSLENQKVEEVHAAQDKQHQTYLIRQSFDPFLRACDHGSDLQCKSYVAEVDQIKSND